LQQGIRDLYSRGNRFLAGCDSLVPGFCLHDELEWFTKAGLSPLQALQTATINPARFLGRETSQGTSRRANDNRALTFMNESNSGYGAPQPVYH